MLIILNVAKNAEEDLLCEIVTFLLVVHHALAVVVNLPLILADQLGKGGLIPIFHTRDQFTVLLPRSLLGVVLFFPLAGASTHVTLALSSLGMSGLHIRLLF